MSLIDAKITDSMINDHFYNLFDMYDWETKTVKRCRLCGAELCGRGDDLDHELCGTCTKYIKDSFKDFVKSCMDITNFDETADIIIEYAADELNVKSAYTEEEKRN